MSSTGLPTSKATCELLDATHQILKSKALVVADKEHFTKEIINHANKHHDFDILIPALNIPRIKKIYPSLSYKRKWAGFAIAETRYNFENDQEEYRLIVQRIGEKQDEYEYKSFLTTSKKEARTLICENYDKRWSVEEFFRFENELGISRASTFNLNIRYGKLALALMAQAATYQLRKKMNEDYQKWGSQLKAYQKFQIHAAIAAPLMIGNQTLGVIGVMHSDADQKFINSDVSLLNLFAQQAAIAVANAKLYEEQKHQSRMDITTDIYNRRGLLELGQRELERSRRTDQPLAAIMVDIDFFKHTNDTYGHPLGDLVLQELAQRFKMQLRAVDILSRFGGEEFLILLPSTNQEEAYLIAERLRKTVAGFPFTTENLSIPITISSGVAVIKEKNATLSDLISHADKAMYQSKKSGRNCVSVYGLPDKN